MTTPKERIAKARRRIALWRKNARPVGAVDLRAEACFDARLINEIDALLAGQDVPALSCGDSVDCGPFVIHR